MSNKQLILAAAIIATASVQATAVRAAETQIGLACAK
jgi:hypothetical protein